MTQRILGPTGSPRRRRILLFPALLTAIAALLFIGGAASAPTGSGVQNSGLFQLDGLRNPCAAFRTLSRAYTLDRYNPAVALDGGPLDQSRARARKRGCA